MFCSDFLVILGEKRKTSIEKSHSLFEREIWEFCSSLILRIVEYILRVLNLQTDLQTCEPGAGYRYVLSVIQIFLISLGGPTTQSPTQFLSEKLLFLIQDFANQVRAFMALKEHF